MSDISRKIRLVCTFAAAATLVPPAAHAQQAIDSAYTAQIKQDL